jgi:hypothetical protein
MNAHGHLENQVTQEWIPLRKEGPRLEQASPVEHLGIQDH